MKKKAALLAVAAALLLGGHPADAARATRPAKKMARFLGQKKVFRKQSATRSEFEARFESALEAPSDLMRSYAGVFWRMASKTPPKRRLAKVGRVFGDAHRENFGFVRVGEKTVYGMTDYDDSGEGFVDDDAAHYFAELRLAEGKQGKKLVARAIAQYAAAVADPSAAVDIDPELAPDWDRTTRNDLDRTVKGSSFRYRKNPELRRAGRKTRSRLEEALAGNPALGGLEILDVAELTRTRGGSGGLTRYWLLVKPKGGEAYTIELKQIGQPGVGESGVAQEVDPAVRLRDLKQAFWGTSAAGDWFPMDVSGTQFLVRNRHTVEKVDLGRLKKSDYEKVILAQASYMARVHRSAWAGVSAADIEKDVAARTADFAKAYRKAHQKLAD